MIEVILTAGFIAALGALYGGVKGARIAVGVVVALVVVFFGVVIGMGIYQEHYRVEHQVKADTDQDPYAEFRTAAPEEKPAEGVTVRPIQKQQVDGLHAFIHTNQCASCKTPLKDLCYWNTKNSPYHYNCLADRALLLSGDEVVMLSEPQRTPDGHSVRKVRYHNWKGWVLEENLSSEEPKEPEDPWEEAARTYKRTH